MEIAAGLFIYLISLSIILLPERVARPMARTGLVAAAVGFLALAFLFLGPRDFRMNHPLLGKVFDPYGHSLYYGFLLLCGTGMQIGYGVRKLVAYYRRRRSLQA